MVDFCRGSGVMNSHVDLADLRELLVKTFSREKSLEAARKK